VNAFKDREVAAGALLAGLVAAPMIGPWAAGLVHYWGDLTYLHHPWRTFDAQLLQAGRLPLWNPYVYFGMPQSAVMQDGLCYPGSALFAFFPFAWASEAFMALHAALAGWLTYLWLRALRLRPAASLLGALSVALGGVLLRDRQFPNHLSTLAFAPALLLSLGRGPLTLALALALGFLAGHPPLFAASAALALALSFALGARGRARAWGAAAVLSAASSACLLVPALELWRASRRAAGVPLDEALLRRFAPGDLLQWLGPLATGWARFDPNGRWWTCCAIGVVAAGAAAAGLYRLPARRAAGLGALVAAALVLTLGPRWLWEGLPFLKFVRYPGNLSMLALWPLALLAAAGAGRRARALAALCAAELLVYSWRALPLDSAGMFAERGPLVERLQKDLGDERFMLSPLALGAGEGRGPLEWKERLYGLNSAAYRLRSASNFGEPLVPAANYEVMDQAFSSPDAARAAALLPTFDARYLLTPRPLPAVSGLAPDGETLWTFSRSTLASAPALLFPEDAELPARLSALPPGGAPLALERPREDRFSVEGESAAAGWAYVSEPLYPGWTARFDDGAEAVVRPAMTAFQKIPVPPGRWRLLFRYDPESWRAGVLLTLAGLAFWSALALRRRSRWQNELGTS
jgi:hypothetical protein